MYRLCLILFFSLFSVMGSAQTGAIINTSMGEIELSLDEEKAPQTVANFVQYAQSGFYNGTIFHRVIDGFMIQGGGFDAKMNPKPTREAIKNESNNGLRNLVGTIAMARTIHPDSATAQFFINLVNNDSLNYKYAAPEGMGYTVFGRVVRGMNVVNQIAKVSTGNSGIYENVPQKPILIQSIKIIPPSQKDKK